MADFSPSLWPPFPQTLSSPPSTVYIYHGICIFLTWSRHRLLLKDPRHGQPQLSADQSVWSPTRPFCYGDEFSPLTRAREMCGQARPDAGRRSAYKRYYAILLPINATLRGQALGDRLRICIDAALGILFTAVYTSR